MVWPFRSNRHVKGRESVVGDGRRLSVFLQTPDSPWNQIFQWNRETCLQITSISIEGKFEACDWRFVPDTAEISRPSAGEANALRRDDFIGRFKYARVVRGSDFADKIDTYGAINVRNVTRKPVSGDYYDRNLYYQPAPLDADTLLNPRKPKNSEAFFVIMHDEEMPSYYFWRLKRASPLTKPPVAVQIASGSSSSGLSQHLTSERGDAPYQKFANRPLHSAAGRPVNSATGRPLPLTPASSTARRMSERSPTPSPEPNADMSSAPIAQSSVVELSSGPESESEFDYEFESEPGSESGLVNTSDPTTALPAQPETAPATNAPVSSPSDTPAASAAGEQSNVPGATGLTVDTAAKTYSIVVDKTEDPADSLKILDVYNVKSYGFPTIRSKKMIPEKHIVREAYHTPCCPPPDLTKIPPPTAEQLKVVPVIDEISDNDESFVHFKKKLARRERIRKARVHPKSQYDSDICNEIGAKDTLKRDVTLEAFKQLERRAISSERVITKREAEGSWEKDGKPACRICRVFYESIDEDIFQHHQRHRRAYRRGRPFAPAHPRSTSAYETDLSRPPTLAEFRRLERRALLAENEVLEREELCIACGASLLFGSNSAEKHYDVHRAEWETYQAKPEYSETLTEDDVGDIQANLQSWVGRPRAELAAVIAASYEDFAVMRQQQSTVAPSGLFTQNDIQSAQQRISAPSVEPLIDLVAPIIEFTVAQLTPPENSTSQSFPDNSEDYPGTGGIDEHSVTAVTVPMACKKRKRDELTPDSDSFAVNRPPQKKTKQSADDSVSLPPSQSKKHVQDHRGRYKHLSHGRPSRQNVTQNLLATDSIRRRTQLRPRVQRHVRSNRRPAPIDTEATSSRKRRDSERTYVDRTPSPPLSADPSPKIPRAPKKNPDKTYRPTIPETPSPLPVMEKSAKKPSAKELVEKPGRKPANEKTRAKKSSEKGTRAKTLVSDRTVVRKPVATPANNLRVLRSRVVKKTAPAKKIIKGKSKK
ncbi:hypothetical protein MBLNU459_g8143t1 [Dothideomycetes sp. NU459]